MLVILQKKYVPALHMARVPHGPAIKDDGSLPAAVSIKLVYRTEVQVPGSLGYGGRRTSSIRRFSVLGSTDR